MKTNAKPKPEPAPAPETHSKRRQHPRFAVDVQASISVAERQQRARTRDISRAGLCLVTLQAIPRETPIAVELVLTFGVGGTSEPLHLAGEAVWCTALFGAYQIGVKFVDVDDEQARYLNMFIGFLDGSLSASETAFSDEETEAEREREEGGSRGAGNRPPDRDDPFRA